VTQHHRSHIELLLFAEHLVLCPACRLKFVGVYQLMLTSGIAARPSQDDRDRIVDELLAASQASEQDGCCSAPVWRDHLCEYHQGYEDGADAALTEMFGAR
jgi:hypothetical protein